MALMADQYWDAKSRGGKVTTTKIDIESNQKKILSKFDSRCLQCNVPILKGDEVFWTPGKKGSLCRQCGEAKQLSRNIEPTEG